MAWAWAWWVAPLALALALALFGPLIPLDFPMDHSLALALVVPMDHPSDVPRPVLTTPRRQRLLLPRLTFGTKWVWLAVWGFVSPFPPGSKILL